MYKNNNTMIEIRSVLRAFVAERGVRGRALFGVSFAFFAAASSVGLVGLAGWFIAAAALAGISGAAAFIVAYPSSGIRAFAVTRVVFRYLERLTNHNVTFSLLSRLRVYFFERALRIPAVRFERYRSGDLLGRATSDIDALDNVFPRVVVPTFAAFAVCCGAVAFIAYFSVTLAVILAFGCAVVGVALPLASAFVGRGSGGEIARSRAMLRTEVVEAVEGLPEVRSYGAGEVVAARLYAATDSAVRGERAAKLADAAGTSLGTLAAQATILAMLVVGISAYQTAGLAGPIVALAVLLATGIFEQLGALPAAYRALGVTRAAVGRLSEIFASGGEVSGEPGFPESSDGTGTGVRVTGATLSYEGRTTPAIEDFSFEAAAGGVTLLVGPSGSGKTTLMRLVAGELSPDAGRVETCGISPEELVRRVAFVSQDEHVFDATLRENLLLAAPDAPDDVLLYVLDAVALTEFYEGLESGLDTHVGAHGREISGGQRRRLSVARAVLRRPDLLLLDEPTGSLDDETARRMLVGIRENLPDATIIISTHDPELLTETLRHAKVVRVG